MKRGKRAVALFLAACMTLGQPLMSQQIMVQAEERAAVGDVYAMTAAYSGVQGSNNWYYQRRDKAAPHNWSNLTLYNGMVWKDNSGGITPDTGGNWVAVGSAKLVTLANAAQTLDSVAYGFKAPAAGDIEISFSQTLTSNKAPVGTIQVLKGTATADTETLRTYSVSSGTPVTVTEPIAVTVAKGEYIRVGLIGNVDGDFVVKPVITYTSLAPVPPREELQDQYDQSDVLMKDGKVYSTLSRMKLEARMQEAKVLLDSPDTSEDLLTGKIAELSAAKAGLQKIPTERLDQAIMRAGAMASSQFSGSTEGPIANAFDGNLSTWWHSNYSSQDAQRPDHWIKFPLGSSVKVYSIIYQGRGVGNGTFNNTMVWTDNGEQSVADIADTVWTPAGEITFANSSAEQTYVLPALTEANKIRLETTSTYGQVVDTHGSAVEINVVVCINADKTMLAEKVEAMQGLKESLYTPESWAAFRPVLTSAEFLLGEDIWMTDGEVTEQAALLQSSFDALVSVGENVNLDSLAYTIGGQTTVLDAYAHEQDLYQIQLPAGTVGEISFTVSCEDRKTTAVAEPVIITEGAAQGTVLIRSVGGTERTIVIGFNVDQALEAQKQALQTFCDECDAMQDEYSAISWKAFQTVLTSAKALLAQESAAGSEIQKKAEELFASKENLKATPMSGYVDQTVMRQTVAVSSEHPVNTEQNEGPKEFALDNNLGTWWHSNYNTNRGPNHWFKAGLGQTELVNGIEYTPRSGDSKNGRFNTGSVYVNNDASSVADTPEDRWTKVADYEFEDNDRVKTIEFASVPANKVKITTTHTYGSQAGDVDQYACAVELNVKITPQGDKTELKALVQEAEALDEKTYTSESWNALQKALEAAIAFLDPTVRMTADEVGGQAGILQAVKDELVVRVDNADLESLSYTIDGETIPLADFDPAKTEYQVELPIGTAGEISFTALAEAANASVTADPVTIDNKAATAVITVLAGDGSTEKTYTIQFTVKAKEFTVTVINGEEPAAVQEYNHSEVVRLTAQDVPGKQFAYWAYNGEIVSYNVNHFFVVVENATIEAHYATEPAEQLPQILMPKDAAKIEPKGTTNNLIYYGQMVLPKGYTAVECGMLFINQQINDQNLSDFVKGGTVNNVGVVTKLAKSTNAVGQYAFTITGVKTKQTRAGRMFLTYRNTATGEEVTIYSQNAVTLITN